MRKLTFLCVLVILFVSITGCSIFFGDVATPVEYSTQVILDEEVLEDWEMRIAICRSDNNNSGLLPRTNGAQTMVMNNGEISFEQYSEEEKLIDIYPNEDQQNENYDLSRKIRAIVEESEHEVIQNLRDAYYLVSVRGFPEEKDGFVYTILRDSPPPITGDTEEYETEEYEPIHLWVFVVNLETEQPVYIQMIQLDNYSFVHNDWPVLVRP